MDGSKLLLAKDKDEWFYRSLKKYKNLYMFELEFPVDAIQVIQATSICIAGTQNLSKKCELLQLTVPPKLLPKDIEEGLCKDRDFKIQSGGYSTNKIIQIKSLSKDFIATVQQGKSGVAIFKLGGDESALLKELETLTPPTEDLIFSSTTGVIDTCGDQIAQAISDTIYIWDTCSGRYKSSLKYNLAEDIGQKITKIKFWDQSQNNLLFTTTSGQTLLYDTRNKKVNYSHKPAKISTGSTTYSFDSISSINRVYLVDSCGGIESFDLRKPTATGGQSNRVILSEFEDVQHIFEGKLNIEIDPHATNSNFKFIVSGFKQEYVHVFKVDESSGGCGGITSCFVHDGHTKPVTHSIWHQESDNLIFSTDIDSILHAWQFEDQ